MGHHNNKTAKNAAITHPHLSMIIIVASLNGSTIYVYYMTVLKSRCANSFKEYNKSGREKKLPQQNHSSRVQSVMAMCGGKHCVGLGWVCKRYIHDNITRVLSRSLSARHINNKICFSCARARLFACDIKIARYAHFAPERRFATAAANRTACVCVAVCLSRSADRECSIAPGNILRNPHLRPRDARAPATPTCAFSARVPRVCLWSCIIRAARAHTRAHKCGVRARARWPKFNLDFVSPFSWPRIYVRGCRT